MRRAIALVLLTVPLFAGCLQGSPEVAPSATGTPGPDDSTATDPSTAAGTPRDDGRATPEPLVERARTFAATWWRPDAALHRVAAHATTGHSLWGISPAIDGRNASWTFGFAAPGADTALSATFDADGELVASQQVPAARLGFTAATARAHAALPDHTLDTRALLAALQANATALGFIGGSAERVAYVLATGNHGPTWTLTIDRGATRHVATVAAETWTVLEAHTRSRYGERATEPAEVVPDLRLEGIYGHRAFASNGGGALEPTLTNLSLHVSLPPGVIPIDLSGLMVRYSDGASVREMNYSEASADALRNGSYATQFRIDELRDDDASFTAATPVATSGDLLQIHLLNVDLAVRTPVTVTLIPTAGVTIPADFVTPSTYGVKQNVVLR